MKTVFVINPVAGQGKKTDALVREIRQAAAELGREVEIYKTKAVGDAEVFARKYAEAWKEEEVRVFACGGDGTVNEVLNGIMGHENAALGVVPIGSGNDFAKNLGGVKLCRNIRAQLQGESRPTDVLNYAGLIDGEQVNRYADNMFNIGFDCNVADTASQLKQKPLIAGSFAYLLAIFSMLIEKKGANVRIEADGKILSEGPILLNSYANGPYCGGGIKSNPYSDLHDGLMDVNVIHNVSRRRFLSLLPAYMKGTHMELEGIEEIIDTYRVSEVKVTPIDGTMRLCTDGEISDAGEITIRVISDGVKVVYPKED